MLFEPKFFNIRSPLLAQILGVKDARSIIGQLRELGVKIRIRGRHKFVFTEDIMQALEDESENSFYISPDKENSIFYE